MASHAPPPGGIPAALSRFCGRRRELLELRATLAADRLVTVTGPGGIGKTRLVTELARSVAFDFPDGIWFVDLTSIESTDLVGAGIAAAVRAPRAGQAAPLQRAAMVLAQGRQLLILDNCEHLRRSAAEAAWSLLTACPWLAVLATSREPLSVRGERVSRLLPLRLPEQGDVAGQKGAMSEAVELFCDRSLLGHAGDQLPPGVEAGVIEICRRLDGMPLALELAAAWVPTLSLSQIAERLSGSLADISRDDVGRPTRHRSVGASLEGSLRLLTPAQAAAFARLSVFVGGFSLEGALAVLNDDGGDQNSTVELLAALVTRSLVMAETGEERARYRLLEPVRQFAAKQLRSQPEGAEETRRRHLRFLVGLGETAAEAIAGGPDLPWMVRLDAELGNIRAALTWGYASEPEMAARLAASLLVYCTHRRLYDEGLAWTTQAVAHAKGQTRARVLLMAGWYSAERGKPGAADDYLDEAHRIVLDEGCLFETVMVLHAKSVVAYTRGDLDTMCALGEEGLQLARRSGADAELMWAVWAPAVCLSARGEHRRALDLFAEGLSIAVRLDNHSWRSSLLCNTIHTAIDLGDWAMAAHHLRTALEVPAEDPAVIGYLVEAAAILAIQGGDHTCGMRLLAAAREALTRLGYRETPDEAARRRQWIDEGRSGMRADMADAAWEGGLSLSMREAADEARAVVVPAGPGASGDAGNAAADIATGVNALAREADYWSVTYAGVVARLRDSKGLRDIALLLATPGRGVAAVDLVDGPRPPRRDAAREVLATWGFGVEGDAGATIDAAARAAYRARLTDLEEEITEAVAANDGERTSIARQEREILLAQLRTAVGLGGRPRRAHDPAERARKAVRWRVRVSISHIATVHPALGRHLRRSIRTGTICTYDPAEPTFWRITSGPHPSDEGAVLRTAG